MIQIELQIRNNDNIFIIINISPDVLTLDAYYVFVSYRAAYELFYEQTII